MVASWFCGAAGGFGLAGGEMRSVIGKLGAATGAVGSAPAFEFAFADEEGGLVLSLPLLIFAASLADVRRPMSYSFAR